MKPLSISVLALLAATTATSAQERRPSPDFPGEAIIYPDVNYSGPAVNVSRATENLGLAWPVRSIRIRTGRWELCTRTRFRGACETINYDTPDLRGSVNRLNIVQSMRPLPGGGGYPIPPVPPGPPAGQSLRGMGAEFFPAPGVNGRRILSCPGGGSTANCAARTADRFCVDSGWNGSGHESQETVGRAVYLADVLCVRSGY